MRLSRVVVLATLPVIPALWAQSPPVITLVANAEGENPVIAPNMFVEVKGTGLAKAGDSRQWATPDFVNNQMPTQLDGVSVTVNGKNAYVCYISPTQVNIVTPADAIEGTVLVQVTTTAGSSPGFSVQAQAVSPSFFTFNGGPYAVAEHANGSLIGPASLYPGLTTPPTPGEIIQLYANGFGQTSTPVVSGANTQSGTLPTLPAITIGGIAASVQFAGLVSPALFQFNVVIPPNAKLQIHPHIHCVVASGGLSPDHTRWVRPRRENFFLPEAVLREVFRGKFADALKHAFNTGELQFHGQLKLLAQPRVFKSFLRQLFRHQWVVYCKPPFGGPDQVLLYLGAYTHRIAISNYRLVSFNDEKVTFRFRDSADHNKKRLMSLPADEFLRRLLLHVLPRGFVRIRHFGFLASRRRGSLVPLSKQLLADAPVSIPACTTTSPEPVSLWTCPICGGPMVLIERLTAPKTRTPFSADKGCLICTP